MHSTTAQTFLLGPISLGLSSSHHFTTPSQRLDTGWSRANSYVQAVLHFTIPQPHDLKSGFRFPVTMVSDVASRPEVLMVLTDFPSAEDSAIVVLWPQVSEEAEFDFGTWKGCEPVSCLCGFRTTPPALHRPSLNEPVLKGV